MRRKARIFIIGVFACVYIFCTGYYMTERELKKTLFSVEFRNLSKYGSANKHDTQKCMQERTNFVFIKCMKCATESLGTVFRRFGYKRNLNFALPVKRNLYLGWPYPFEKKYVRPSKSEYNILFEHSVYNGPVMKSVMPNDTVFITMIRNPWEQFKSSYNYFGLGKIAGVRPGNDINKYLRNIEAYETVYKSPENNARRWCFPDGFSMTRNIMSHCLGMPLGFPKGWDNISNNFSAIRSYIQHLDENFLLIMIADYFYESLVLLRRLMCWTLKDVLFYQANLKSYDFKSLPPKGRLFEIHQNWSKVDYMLFEYFNKTFWKKVADQGKNFKQEVDHFRLVQLTVDRFCFVESGWLFPKNYLTIPSSRSNDPFNVTGEDCYMMRTYMLTLLWERYYQNEGLEPEKFRELKNRPKPSVGCSIWKLVIWLCI